MTVYRYGSKLEFKSETPGNVVLYDLRNSGQTNHVSYDQGIEAITSDWMARYFKKDDYADDHLLHTIIEFKNDDYLKAFLENSEHSNDDMQEEFIHAIYLDSNIANIISEKFTLTEGACMRLIAHDMGHEYVAKAIEKNPLLLIKLLGRLYRLYDDIQLVKAPIAYPTAD